MSSLPKGFSFGYFSGGMVCHLSLCLMGKKLQKSEKPWSNRHLLNYIQFNTLNLSDKASIRRGRYKGSFIFSRYKNIHLHILGHHDLPLFMVTGHTYKITDVYYFLLTVVIIKELPKSKAITKTTQENTHIVLSELELKVSKGWTVNYFYV